jgi:hypothetical protein
VAARKPKKLAEHVVKDHDYPYDDAEKLQRSQLEGWHVHKHQAEAQHENSRFEKGVA